MPKTGQSQECSLDEIPWAKNRTHISLIPTFLCVMILSSNLFKGSVLCPEYLWNLCLWDLLEIQGYGRFQEDGLMSASLSLASVEILLWNCARLVHQNCPDMLILDDSNYSYRQGHCKIFAWVSLYPHTHTVLGWPYSQDHWDSFWFRERSISSTQSKTKGERILRREFDCEVGRKETDIEPKHETTTSWIMVRS